MIYQWDMCPRYFFMGQNPSELRNNTPEFNINPAKNDQILTQKWTFSTNKKSIQGTPKKKKKEGNSKEVKERKRKITAS